MSFLRFSWTFCGVIFLRVYPVDPDQYGAMQPEPKLLIQLRHTNFGSTGSAALLMGIEKTVFYALPYLIKGL